MDGYELCNYFTLIDWYLPTTPTNIPRALSAATSEKSWCALQTPCTYNIIRYVTESPLKLLCEQVYHYHYTKCILYLITAPSSSFPTALFLIIALEKSISKKRLTGLTLLRVYIN